MPWQADHQPQLVDGLCARCDLPSSAHRVRVRRGYMSDYNAQHPRENPSERIIGIDGEGQGRRPHKYFYLAAADELGNRWDATPSDPSGRLSTRECLDFILDLPGRSLIVGYAFVYDLTKILQDMTLTPAGRTSLFLLFHEPYRARKVPGKGGSPDRIVYKPVKWSGYELNYMNRRFSVKRGTRRATVWDIFRFFQGKFTRALIDWKVADLSKLTRMSDMKDKRAVFDRMGVEEVYAYCQEECDYLAKLARGLLDAHEQAGLKLKHYYGAGSTASAFLERIDVKSKRGEVPGAMREPIACAFFGGRFENSVLGPVAGPVWNYDISSAYPYQATFLPCLSCGVWRFDRLGSGIHDARLALVNWSIGPIQRSAAWGPLPVRNRKGTIIFPLSGQGGWTWKEEYLAAQRLEPTIECKGAWLYETDCVCAPFATIPEVYRERVRLGKDAAGIVLKLGTNSIYGKLAQSVGLSPPYQSWVWAGNITSGCRAQLLDLLSLAPQRWSVLMLATDGLFCTERLQPPLPRGTGTGDLAKPLGGWEEKRYENGIFAVRPGIYFPLNPTVEQLDSVRARGLGKKILYEQWPRIVEAYERNDPGIEIRGVERFVGAKSALHYAADKVVLSEDYGEWVEYPIKVTFDPRPKRQAVMADGRLEPHYYTDFPSVPYNRAVMDAQTEALRLAELIAEEQPDADFSGLE